MIQNKKIAKKKSRSNIKLIKAKLKNHFNFLIMRALKEIFQADK